MINSVKNKNKIISRCITSNNIGTLSSITSANSLKTIEIGAITLDLTEFCDPVVMISLSGSISPITPDTQYSEHFFRVIRCCDSSRVTISNNLSPGSSVITNTESFLYQICDCNPLACPCSNIVTYLIEFTPGIIAGRTIINFNDLVITAYIYERDSSLINCNMGNAISLFNTNVGTTLTVPGVELGSISIDTSHYCDVRVLIIFSGDINLTMFNFSTTTPIAPLTASIQLVKSCDDCCNELLSLTRILTSTTVLPGFTTIYQHQLIFFLIYIMAVKVLAVSIVILHLPAVIV